ncbi:MAG: peptide deformylase [Actinobacteria bacterium]|nr:peptide deformylase [Actinomycetota bacterium]
MAVLPIRTFGDPVLRERCSEVGEVDVHILRLVDDLADSMPRPGGAGLSANQIGILKRVFVYDDDGEIAACINPRLISASEEMVEEMEGCLSLPGAVVPVKRHASLELEFIDLHGEKKSLQAEGWLARVFQHELDHLDGILILDRTDRESRVEALQILHGAPGQAIEL